MELYKIRKTSRQSNPFRFIAVKQLHPGRLPVIKKTIWTETKRTGKKSKHKHTHTHKTRTIITHYITDISIRAFGKLVLNIATQRWKIYINFLMILLHRIPIALLRGKDSLALCKKYFFWKSGQIRGTQRILLYLLKKS